VGFAIVSVFPTLVLAQIGNSLATRQIRGTNEHEVVSTGFGDEDDPPEMAVHRLRQANLIGPAGLVSMEDGEAIEIAHRASASGQEATTVVELGGGGLISDRDYRVNDVPVRGFGPLRGTDGYRSRRRGPMTIDRDRIFDLLAHGALIDAAQYEEWLGLFASECRYQVMPRENWQHGLPAALMFCDSRAMLEDRVLALREANKYNIHTDRHLIGLPRITDTQGSLLPSRRHLSYSRPMSRARVDCSRLASTGTRWCSLAGT
jgi:hypothetical protein